jgi:plasmid rolling circle replication initiator protein Rep
MCERCGQSDHSLYLTDFSPVDKPWDKHRATASTVQSLYSQVGYAKYADRIRDCSGQLGFAFEARDEGELKLRLRTARFCRVRHCPVCQWRRSLVWRARFFTAIPKVLEGHPKSRWVFLTLTVRNCPLEGLRGTVNQMNKAWNKLVLRKQFPAIGFVKSLEVTRGKDNSAHPHFHILMMVPPSYFSHGYITQAEWRNLWGSCLKVGYLPVVNVKVIKPRSTVEDNGLQIAILETLKYGVKESDLIADANWLMELTKQLHKTRAVSVGGVLKNYLSEEEPEDLVNTDENEIETATNEDVSIWFGWREMVKRYVKEERN